MRTPQRGGTCASTRAALLCASASALRLRLLPDDGLAQLFLTASIQSSDVGVRGTMALRQGGPSASGMKQSGNPALACSALVCA